MIMGIFFVVVLAEGNSTFGFTIGMPYKYGSTHGTSGHVDQFWWFSMSQLHPSYWLQASSPKHVVSSSP
jgi:hypothetical protein